MRNVTLVLILLSTATAAHAQSPRWVRLSYAAGDAATSITMSWNADSAMDPPTVRFGRTTAYGEEATGVAPAAALPDALGFVHEVTLTDLAPDTLYHYSAGTPGAWSPDAVFMTAPADGCSPLTFAAMGDCRSDTDAGANAKWHDILQEAWEQDPLFAVNTGDLVRDGSQPGQWQDFMEKTAFASPMLAQMPVIGNHDDDTVQGDGALYNQLFALPRNDTSNTEDYYAFTAGNAVFAILSSQTFHDDDFAAQAAWLDATLTTHADKQWKFVFLHHPIYTSHAAYDLGFYDFEFNHPPNEQGQNAALVPVFDAHHVDVVFVGHNHYYERFEPLVGGGGDDEGGLAGSFAGGTVYITTGGAGAFTYDDFEVFGITIDLIGWLCGYSPAAGSAFCDGRHHYVVIELVNNVLTLRAISTTQQNFGTETPEEFDTITITKPQLDPCLPAPDGQGFGDSDSGGDAAGYADGGPDGGAGPDGGDASTGGDLRLGDSRLGDNGGSGSGSDTDGAVSGDDSSGGVPGGCTCHSSSARPTMVLLVGWVLVGFLRAKRWSRNEAAEPTGF